MTFDGRLFSGITVLAAVAESGSFVRAADALGLSPSGVSRAVARLEKRVGVRLLDRTTRSQTLTDEGRRLYEAVGPHLTGIEEAATAAAGSANVVQGKLRVNVDPFFSRTVLASRLADFLSRHPDLSLELIMRDDVGDLVADGFDLAVRFGPPPSGSLIARKLLETRIITVASPGYVAAYGKPANPEAVRTHQRIMFYNPVTARPFEWEFHRGKKVTEIPAEGRLLVSDVETMLEACMAGAGIAQVMEIGVEQIMRDGALVDIFPDWSDERFPLYALFPSRRHRAAKVEAFMHFCVESLSAVAPVTRRPVSVRGERSKRKGR
ncbi:LysR family transcriptional regulator [Paraburkholderia sp. DHOC27]|uniref:LysR family transcriptional regulator n=1 Tax=Paraburkholderia sp. DHOC27 TaxID=2303330 RepID=UPI000E3B98A1|nr:LysR family transcriptional regulator [Paraburkholderia sp. DHOC27]RFU49602.1 LysR family transcriptional regulator [Paraburkholderia sp. DHOC27]